MTLRTRIRDHRAALTTVAFLLGALVYALWPDSKVDATAVSSQEAKASIKAFVGKDLALKDEGLRRATPNQTRAFQGTGDAAGYVFEVDILTGEVLIAIFPHTPGPTVISGLEAKLEAVKFAAARYKGFDQLRLVKDAAFLDHGELKEYSFEWRHFVGEAIAPSAVSLGINAADGKILHYAARRVDTTLSAAEPAISKEDAIARGVRLAKYDPTERSAQLEIWVDPDTGIQRLVWRVRLNGLRPAKPGVPVSVMALPGNFEAILDAQSGSTISTSSG